ncbi:Uncharacterised protein [Legionella beliardensis]|uniref:Uncharacterized protein n=1 Tax=Legionella beliardensis TaxID=91822 RepID=A0A378JSM6_9GAMM|nr:hypothetical protein [Legionella beliardensis]STX55672.1 Uncharacterised protein [Legionella beliardensis]
MANKLKNLILENNLDQFFFQSLGSIISLVFGLIILTSIIYMAGFLNATGVSTDLLPITFIDIIGALIKFSPDIIGDFMPIIIGYFFFEVSYFGYTKNTNSSEKKHTKFSKELWFFILSFFLVSIGFLLYYFTSNFSLLLIFLYYALFGLIIFLWAYLASNKNFINKYGSIMLHILFLFIFSIIYFIKGFTDGLDVNFYEKKPISIYTNKAWQPAYFIYQLDRGIILRVDNKVEFIANKLIGKIRYN